MPKTWPLLIFAGFAAAQLCCTADSRKPEPKAAEAAHEVPARKHDTLSGLDHGLLQSPVNILTGEVEDGDHKIAINLHDADPEYLANKGHTIQLDFPEGSSISFEGRDYTLQQIHFHTPSEHQIDDVTFPMEMHVVNKSEPKTPEGLRWTPSSPIFRRSRAKAIRSAIS